MRWTLAVLALTGCAGEASTGDVATMVDVDALTDRIEAVEARLAAAEALAPRVDQLEADVTPLVVPGWGVVVETARCADDFDLPTIGADLPPPAGIVQRFALVHEHEDGFMAAVEIPPAWPTVVKCSATVIAGHRVAL